MTSAKPKTIAQQNRERKEAREQKLADTFALADKHIRENYITHKDELFVLSEDGCRWLPTTETQLEDYIYRVGFFDPAKPGLVKSVLRKYLAEIRTTQSDPSKFPEEYAHGNIDLAQNKPIPPSSVPFEDALVITRPLPRYNTLPYNTLPRTRTQLIRTEIPYKYYDHQQPLKTEANHFKSFLEVFCHDSAVRSLPSNVPRPADKALYIEQTKKLIAYTFAAALTGNPSDSIAIFYGEGGTGKTKLGEIAAQLVGLINTFAPKLKHIDGQFQAAEMEHAKLVLWPELPSAEAPNRDYLTAMLDISGKTPLSAEKKGVQSQHLFIPQAMLIASTNRILQLTAGGDADRSAWLRRLYIITTPEVAAADDPDLVKHIVENGELPHIAHWALTTQLAMIRNREKPQNLMPPYAKRIRDLFLADVDQQFSNMFYHSPGSYTWLRSEIRQALADVYGSHPDSITKTELTTATNILISDHQGRRDTKTTHNPNRVGSPGRELKILDIAPKTDFASPAIPDKSEYFGPSNR